MPIYEYQCQDCDTLLEVLQKFSDAPRVDCPDCGRPSLKKKVSAAAFRLKGGGWYETDFKTGNKRNLAGDTPAKADSGSPEKKAPTSKPSDKKSSGATKSSSNA